VIKQFEQLVEEFKRLPKLSQSNPTYMEIAGYPHYENVCSNVLSFFFDTKQSHDLNDLVIKSLLDTVDETISNKYDLTTFDIIREFYTDKGNRIDLVIELDELVIAIENKIFHHLNNELIDYQKTITKRYSNKKVVFIVLSLKKETIINSDFVSVIYDDFFKNIKKNIGDYLFTAHHHYINLLRDFITTIENLYKMEPINKEYFDFYIKNKEIIQQQQEEHNKLSNSLIRTVRNVMSQLTEKAENQNMWLYDKVDIVNDFTFDGNIVVSLDTAIHLDKVSSILWVRKKGNKEVYEILDQLQLIKENPHLYRKTPTNHGYIIFSEEEKKFFEINPEEFANRIQNILNKIKY